MNSDINRHAMYYGAILGVAFCLLFFLSTANSVLFSVLYFMVLFSVPYMTYKMAAGCRDKVCDGYMSYSMALWYVVRLFIYASFISAMVKFIYFSFINPEYLQKQFETSMSILEQTPLLNTMNDDAIDLARKQATSPIVVSLQTIWVNLMGGLIVGLIVAAIVKKEKSIFDKDIENLSEKQ